MSWILYCLYPQQSCLRLFKKWQIFDLDISVLDAMLFWGAFAKQLLKMTNSFDVSLCPSVYQSHSHQADFCEVTYLRFLLKVVDMFQFLLKVDKKQPLDIKTYVHILSIATIEFYNWDIMFSVRCVLRPVKQL